MIKIISLVLGFILGYLTLVVVRQPKIIKGPDSNQIKKNIYQDRSGQCYHFVPKITICPI